MINVALDKLDFTLPFDIEIGLQPANRLWLPVVEVAA